MSPDIIIVLVILGGALTLLVTEVLRADLVALLVLLALTLTNLVEPVRAVSGFSSSAVLAVAAILVLSAGLQRVGVATMLGNSIARLGGRGEIRLVIAIMSTAAVLSFFMNTLAIVALLLPPVMDLARRTGVAPSRLLMPLTFGALLGGLTTMFATLPNLLASAALKESGREGFGIFDFLPVGVAAAVSGILFIAFIGRHLLPVRDLQKESSAAQGGNLREHYELHERMFVLRLPPSGVLSNKTLEESRLGSALGLHVVAILRDGQTQLAPERSTRLRGNDRLLVQGTPDQLNDLEGWRQLRIASGGAGIEKWFSADINFAQVRIAPGSRFEDQTLPWLDVRRRWGVNVLAVRRGGEVSRSHLPDWRLQAGDVLLLQGLSPNLESLREVAGLEEVRIVPRTELADVYKLEERLFTLEVPEGSMLADRTLAQSRLGEALGLTVLAIARGDTKIPMPGPKEVLHGGDALLVEGRSDDLLLFQGIQDLALEREVASEVSEFESERLGLGEVILSPRTSLSGKTLKQLRFRERYGLAVLGVWRGGQALTTRLGGLALEFGDALLLYGPREKLLLLGRDADFIVLTRAAQEPCRSEKALGATLAMLAFLVPVSFGWLPIHIGALVGAALMVLLGCLRLDEAYDAIELKPVVLIAGMLPLSAALESTGAAAMAAENLVQWVGGLGPLAIIGSIFLITALGTCLMPGVALIVLLSPVALKVAGEGGVSPHAVMMAMAVAASGGFLSPIAHPSNIMIMGPGGYRFTDFMKLGVPLTLIVFVVVLVVLPMFWPLSATP